MALETLVTAERLAAMPDDGTPRELVNGKIRKLTLHGALHGMACARLVYELGSHVDSRSLGGVYLGTGFILTRDPDTVRAPDLAFVNKNRLAKWVDSDGYGELPPDLAIEVVSFSDSYSDVQETMFAWLAAGVPLVLIADPANKTIRAARSNSHFEEFHPGQKVDCRDVVPGWVLEVDEIFAQPDSPPEPDLPT